MARYLITGGAGFIGSHLVEHLLKSGDSVIVFDDLSTGRIENLSGVLGDPALRLVQASVLDRQAVAEAVSECDSIFHLAAAVGVRLIIGKPLDSLMTNVQGSINVFDSAARYGTKILATSSSEIYGKNSNVPLTENSERVLGSPSVSRWAYSTAKAIEELLAFAYYRELGLPTIVVRLFNTVGPRQSDAYGMVVPRFVQQALSGEQLTVFGDGQQTRSFCHVADAVRAIVQLMETPAAVGDVFNVGSTDEISIAGLAKEIVKQADSPSAINHVPYNVAYEGGFEDVDRRQPDTSKLQALTGWSPSYKLADILHDVISDVQFRRAEGSL